MAIDKKTGQKIVIDRSHRLSGIDAAIALEILQSADQLLVPEDQRQRTAFIPLMPHLYVLRRKGCSWGQLTNLLTQAGFKLQASTVRQYYGEELAVRQDLCEARLTDSLLAIAATRKAAMTMDQAAISEQLKAKAVQVKVAAAEKLNAIFGTSVAGGGNPAGAAPPGAAKLDAVFGSGGAGAPRPLAPPLEVEPVGQQAAMPPAAASSNSTALPPQLVCQKLQEGVPRLEKRDTIADDMYLPGNLEHPAIPGLFLTLDQRLYGAYLEYADSSDGVIKLESAHEKRFRMKWQKTIPPTISSTDANSTKMNLSLFKKHS